MCVQKLQKLKLQVCVFSSKFLGILVFLSFNVCVLEMDVCVDKKFLYLIGWPMVTYVQSTPTPV